MASVVLQQNLPGFSTTGVNRATLQADTASVRSVVTSGSSVLRNTAQPGQPSVTIGTTVQLSTITAPSGATAPTAFTDTLATYTGGGVTANQRTVTLSADPNVAVAGSPALALGAFGTSYPAPVPAVVGPPAVAATTQPVVRLPPSSPLGLSTSSGSLYGVDGALIASGLIGQLTGQPLAAPSVVAVPGITAGSRIRFYMLSIPIGVPNGAEYPGFDPAVPLVITPNVGFSVGCTEGVTYGYEVLLA